MKRATVPVELFGEKYRLSGNPVIIRAGITLFREFLERIQKENSGREVSTYRLAVMTGMALAVELVRFKEEQKKTRGLTGPVHRHIRELIAALEEKKKP